MSHRIGLLEENLEEIDERIGDSMDNWRLDRLSRLDRAVLRLAVTELLFPFDVPPRVAIQEGIRLAGQYGGDESSRFVNGVLDAVYRAHAARP
jgi:N utilization substance protein B